MPSLDDMLDVIDKQAPGLDAILDDFSNDPDGQALIKLDRQREAWEKQTWSQATFGSVGHGALGTAASIMDTAEREAITSTGEAVGLALDAGGKTINRMEKKDDWLHPALRYNVELTKSYWGIGEGGAEGRQKADEATGDLMQAHAGKSGAGQLSEHLKAIQAEHPEWAPRQIEGVGHLLSDPKTLVGNVTNMIPFMAATTAAFLAGGPSGAALISYAVESDQAYQTAIQSGATVSQAQTSARITGTINAIIEQAQVDQWLKFGKQAGRTALTREITKRVKAKMIAGAAAKLAFQEGLEEVLQGTTQDLSAWGVYGKVPQDFLKNRAIEGILGASGGLMMGGASAAVHAAIPKVKASDAGRWTKLPQGEVATLIEKEYGLTPENAAAAVQRAYSRKGDVQANLAREVEDELKVSYVGLSAFADADPEGAAALADIENPSRGDFDKAGLPRRSASDRSMISLLLREILSEEEEGPTQTPQAAPTAAITPEQAQTGAQEEIVAPGASMAQEQASEGDAAGIDWTESESLAKMKDVGVSGADFLNAVYQSGLPAAGWSTEKSNIAKQIVQAQSEGIATERPPATPETVIAPVGEWTGVESGGLTSEAAPRPAPLKKGNLKADAEAAAPAETPQAPAPAKPVAKNKGPKQAPPARKPLAAKKVGSFDVALPSSKARVKGKWAIVELGDILSSSDAGYDADLQPRDRSRVASKEQIAAIAANLDPTQLGESAVADTGAPLVDGSGQMISGNGRTLGIREAYRIGKAEGYAASVRKTAKSRGLNADNLKQPVLVRVITDSGGLTLPQVAEFANRSNILQRSAAELAEADAKAIMDGGLLKSYAPSESGDMRAASNRAFLDAFVEATGAGDLRQADGTYSAAIDARVRRAVLAAILGNTEGAREIVTQAVERSDELGIKRQMDGLMIVGGELLRVGQAKPSFDISEDLAVAIDQYIQFRASGIETPGDWARQINMFDSGMTVEQRILFMNIASAKSAKAIVDYFNAYLRVAERVTSGGSLFGEPVGPQTAADIIKDIENDRAKTDRQADLFGRRASEDSRGQEANDQGEGTGDSDAGAEAAAEVAPAITRESFRDSMKDAFNLTDDQADAVAAIAEAAAARWGKLAGRDASEFYPRAFAGVTTEAPAGEGLVQGNLAAVTIGKDGKAVIHALADANVSSAVHEVSHVFHRQLELLAANGVQDAKADLQTLSEWTGEKSTTWDSWSRDSKEKVARAFERYLRDGKAPTAGLRSVFAKFKSWLTGIYKTLKGSAINIKISPEVRAVFDRMLGGEGKVAQAEEVTVTDEADLLSNLDSMLAEEPGGGDVLHQAASEQTQAAAFKKWFGDSKVVDADGKPLVAYHGTTGGEDIQVFQVTDEMDAGHFGDITQADMRAGASTGSARIPVYLSIENPRRSRDRGVSWKSQIASARSAGHDGIVYLNRYEGIRTETILKAQKQGIKLDSLTDAQFKKFTPEAKDSWIAFDASQIKSAIGNRGTFDPSNPNILMQAAESASNQQRLVVASAGLAQADAMSKAGELTYEKWATAVRTKLDSLNKKLSDSIKDSDLSQMWSDMADGTLEHLGESQLDKATRKGMAVAKTAKTVPSKAAVWVDATAVERGLWAETGNIKRRQHEVMGKKEQARMVAALPLEQAVRIALGEEAPPPDLLMGSVFVAVADWATLQGDTALVLKLADSKALDVGTRAGQEVGAFDARDPLDPVRAIRHAIKAAREEFGESTNADPAQIAELQAKLDAATQALDEAAAKVEAAERKTAEAQADAQAAREQTEASKRAKNKGVFKPRVSLAELEIRRKDADAALAFLRDSGRIASTGKSSILFQSPPAVIDAVNAVGRYLYGRGVTKSAWLEKLTDAVGKDLSEEFGKSMWESLDADGSKAAAIEKLKEGLGEMQPLSSMQQATRTLYRAAIADGVEGIENRLNYVHEVLKEIDPSLTREDVRDAFSGYGKVTVPSQEALEVELRDNMAQHREWGKLRDIGEGQYPAATGFQVDEPSQDLRNVSRDARQARQEAETEGKIIPPEGKGHLKSLEASTRTRLKNEILDLSEQIAAGKRKIRDKKQVEYPDDIKALIALRSEKASLLEEIDPKNTSRTDEQKIEAATKYYERRMDQLEKTLASGDFVKPQRQTWREAPDSPAKQAALAAERQARDLARQMRALTGFSVSPEMAAELVDLAGKAKRARVAMEAGPRRESDKAWGTETELVYGMAYVNFQNAVQELNRQATALTFEQFKADPAEAIRKIASTSIVQAVNVGRALQAAYDDSFLLRQGRQALNADLEDLLGLIPNMLGITTHEGPKFVWLRGAGKSFQAIYNTFGGQAVLDTLNANIVSDPNFDRMKVAKLAVGVTEESFPTPPFLERLADRVTAWATKKDGARIRQSVRQVVGSPVTIFKASNNAFTGTAHFMRQMLFNRELAIAKLFGVDIDDARQLKAIGRLVNTQTARGNMKSHPLIDFLLWTPRMMLAHIDTLTMHVRDVVKPRNERMTLYVRARSAMNLLEFVGSVAGIVLLARAMVDDEDEKDDIASLDFTSANAGTIKVGNTRFDVTGGAKAFAVLAWRLASGKYTSSTTGEVRDLTEAKYGVRNSYDVLLDFMGNKFAPFPSQVAQHLQGEDRSLPRIGGKPQTPTILRSVGRQFIPLPFQNMQEVLDDPDSAPFIATYISDFLGASVNTYPGYGPKVHAMHQKIWDSKQAKDAQSEVRLTRVWELIKEQVKEAGGDQLSEPSREARARGDKIANAAIHSESLTFRANGLKPETPAEIKAAFREYYEAKANQKDVPPAYYQEMTQFSKHAATLNKEARATVRASYTVQFTKALTDGDLALAARAVRARKALAVPTKDQLDGLIQSLKDKRTKGEMTDAESRKLLDLGRKAISKANQSSGRAG